MKFHALEKIETVLEAKASEELQKEIDCSYEYSLRLSDILNAINQLGDYTVPIQITPATQPEQHYTGYYTDLI